MKRLVQSFDASMWFYLATAVIHLRNVGTFLDFRPLLQENGILDIKVRRRVAASDMTQRLTVASSVVGVETWSVGYNGVPQNSWTPRRSDNPPERPHGRCSTQWDLDPVRKLFRGPAAGKHGANVYRKFGAMTRGKVIHPPYSSTLGARYSSYSALTTP